MKVFLFLILLSLSQLLSAQIETQDEDSTNLDVPTIDSTKTNAIVDANENDSLAIYKPTEEDYKFFRENQDTLKLSDPFTIKSYYKKNFTQKDYFGKMLPNNIGNTLNDLSYEIEDSSIGNLLPTGKRMNFIKVLDIRYFDVKTPTTEIDYESGVKEGQFLSTLFTHSPNSKINYSLQYIGLRSQGKYLQEFAINNKIILGLNFHTKNKMYDVFTHYAIQNTDNQQNGGIINRSNFEKRSNTFNTRLRIPVNLQGAQSEFTSRRFHVVQHLKLFKQDSIQNNSSLSLKNSFTYEDDQYFYTESETNDFFTSSTISGASSRSENRQANLENKLGIEYKYKSFLKSEIGHLYNDIAYAVLEKSANLPSRINESMHGVYASINTTAKDKFNINTTARYNLSSIYENPYNVMLGADFKVKKDYSLYGNYVLQSAIPKFNYQLNQSFYTDYNYHNASFKNEKTEKIELGINLVPIKTTLSSSLTKLNNMLYLDQNYLAQQLNSSLSILALKLENTLTYRKLNLTTQVSYQKIEDNNIYLPLPQWIGRATLYYQAPAFKNKSQIQTGINAYYFSAFQSREISPFQNEYKLQTTANAYSIGNVPIVDVFMNLKVKRMEIHLKLENISSIITNSYYTLPNVPYTDFRFRFGIKWYLFT